MLNLISFKSLSKIEIRKLRGGPLHNFRYFLAILDGNCITEVIHAKLRNQMGSQGSGFEPFETPYGFQRFCLERLVIRVPELSISGTQTLQIQFVERRACILNPPRGTDEYNVLQKEAEHFRLECQVRQRLTFDNFPIALSLLADTLEPKQPTPHRPLRLEAKFHSQLDVDPAKRFEQLLSWNATEPLKSLCQLLRMPDRPKTGPIPAQAA